MKYYYSVKRQFGKSRGLLQSLDLFAIVGFFFFSQTAAQKTASSIVLDSKVSLSIKEGRLVYGASPRFSFLSFHFHLKTHIIVFSRCPDSLSQFILRFCRQTRAGHTLPSCSISRPERSLAGLFQHESTGIL